jgi:uncharacterized membrane protein YdjX (TVP38/TMEM64 family)
VHLVRDVDLPFPAESGPAVIVEGLVFGVVLGFVIALLG